MHHIGARDQGAMQTGCWARNWHASCMRLNANENYSHLHQYGARDLGARTMGAWARRLAWILLGKKRARSR